MVQAAGARICWPLYDGHNKEHRVDAVTSMLPDLDKHPEIRCSASRDSALNALGILAAIHATKGDVKLVQRYIDGFR
jgi:hypothetical protein